MNSARFLGRIMALDLGKFNFVARDVAADAPAA